jgi:hypothetical protein
MSDYTGLLTGNYYFQLNTGNGFLEASNDKIIKIQANPNVGDWYKTYSHGLKRETVDNIDGYGTTGLSTEFAIGADRLTIKKSYNAVCGFPTDSDTKCIVWDEKNNLAVGASETNAGIDRYFSCGNSILGGTDHTIGSYTCYNSIVGGQSLSVTNYSRYNVIGGQYSCMDNSSYGVIFGYSNALCNTSSSRILGNYNAICYSNNTIIFGYNNASHGGDGNFVNGNNNTVCSQPGHYNATILAGSNNQVYGALNTILGGQYSKIGADAFQVAESYENFSLIGNGYAHYILGSNSTIINGRNNRNIGHNNFIGGGFENCINVTNYDLLNNPSQFNSIQNEIPRGNFIGNGYYNRILNISRSSTILNGFNNRIDNSSCSVILNGQNNFISGSSDSFIIGRGNVINNAFNEASGELFVPLEGVGIINDGTTPVSNYYMPRTLSLGFRYGTFHYPFINLNNDPIPLAINFSGEWKDLNSGYYGGISGEYDGYTGIETAGSSGKYPWAYANLLKMISIGTNNDNRFHAIDISGFLSGVVGKSQTLFRVYDPSVVIGANNSPSHQNILIGVNNRSRYTAIEDISTGLYGPGVSGIRIPNVKTLNKGPWPIVTSTWPFYQGMNTLIGHNNNVTGAGVNAFGISNLVQDNAGPSLLAGSFNSLISESGTYQTGENGVILSFTRQTGYLPIWKKNTIMLGFSNTERLGLWANIIGTQNSTFSNSSNVLGFDNNASGAYLNIVGKSNLTYGLNNSAFGTNNLVIDGQNNTAIGVNNIINQLAPTGAARPIDNNLLGNGNYVIGSNSLLLGLRNRFGYTTGVYLYDSILIGNNNISENSFTTAVGLYNYTTGFYSSTFGSNNQISGGSYNGIFGSNNVNFGTNSYSIGSNNKVYNEGGMALGNQAFSYNKNQVSIAGGSNGTSWPGSSQKTHLFWKGITSGAANTELMLDGVFSDGTYVSGKAFIPSGVIWNGTVNIIASETGLNNALLQTRLVSAANRAGTMHLINNTVLNSNTTGTATWGLTVSMDSTYQALRMTATGSASKVIYWSVLGEFNEAFIPTREAITVNRYLDNTIVGQVLQGTPDISSSTIEATYPKSPNRPRMGQGSYLPS